MKISRETQDTIEAALASGQATEGPKMPRRRTRSEVLAARANAMVGCCNRFSDQMACDCLSEALPDGLSEPFTDEVGRGSMVPCKWCGREDCLGCLPATPIAPVELRLPYPPTLNTYYRHVGSKVLISEAGREYREKVCKIVSNAALLGQAHHLTGRLSVCILAHPPDRRSRDLDNLLKAVLDALQHAGLYESDSQIDSLLIRRGNTRPAGELFVIVRQQMEEQC